MQITLSNTQSSNPLDLYLMVILNVNIEHSHPIHHIFLILNKKLLT